MLTIITVLFASPSVFAIEPSVGEKQCSSEYASETRSCGNTSGRDPAEYRYCVATAKQALRLCCSRVGGSPACARPAEVQKNSYIGQSRERLNHLLTHPIFQTYENFIVDTIREGEIGESQAYFIRLVKPFDGSNEGYCFTFLGASKLREKPRACAKPE